MHQASLPGGGAGGLGILLPHSALRSCSWLAEEGDIQAAAGSAIRIPSPSPGLLVKEAIGAVQELGLCGRERECGQQLLQDSRARRASGAMRGGREHPFCLRDGNR